MRPIVYYSYSDLSFFPQRDSVLEVVKSDPIADALDANGAMELLECLKFVNAASEHAPHYFDPESLGDVKDKVRGFKAVAGRALSQILSSQDLSTVMEALEPEYVTRFWEAVDACNLGSKIDAKEFETAFNSVPKARLSFRYLLARPKLVKAFDESIAQLMRNHVAWAAETIASSILCENAPTPINLPQSLTSDDIERILFAYLELPDANPNYVGAIAKWPAGLSLSYRPSRKVLTKAARKERRIEEEFFEKSNSSPLITELELKIDRETDNPIEAFANKPARVTIVYGLKHLESSMDFEGILSNLIDLFGVVNPHIMMTYTNPAHNRSALFDAITTRVKGEFKKSESFDFINNKQVLQLLFYRQFLAKHGISLEELVAQFFSDILPDIFGFSPIPLSFPAADSTYFEKCKSIGPEIERVAKAWLLFVEDGEIDPEQLPHVSFKGFSSLPSLLSNKYLVPGENFEQRGALLFSDQSTIAYLAKSNMEEYPQLFELIESRNPTMADLREFVHPAVAWLINEGFIEQSDDGSMTLPERAHLLKLLWERDALPRFLFVDALAECADALQEEGVVRYVSQLLAPPEAEYFDYMFNNVSFSNSRALRNKYDHGNDFIEDSNSTDYEMDYGQLLLLLIVLTLKIWQELSVKQGTL